MNVWEYQPINVPQDTCLIFEGGGMRCTYSSALCNVLMENGIHFPHVYGISAGSSCSVGYLGGDTDYMYGSFVGMATDPELGGWKYFLRGKGFFNAERIYVPGILPGGAGPYPYKQAMDNPTEMTIQAFQRDTGASVLFTKEDFARSPEDMMVRVRACSTVPIMMPAPVIEGEAYYDGGLADNAGILPHQAMKDGYRRFFSVHSRPRGYRKEPVKHPGFYKAYFWRHPLVARAIINRIPRYNALLDEIDELNAQGWAYSVFAEDITCSSGTLDHDLLQRNYEAAYAQGQRQVGDWKSWLNVA